MDQIPAAQVNWKKRVGKIDDAEVWALSTVGGLNLVVKSLRGGKTEVLGAGPHRAIARHIAERQNPSIVWTTLEKGEHFPVETFEWLIPEAEAMTKALRNAQGF